jgi:hypothetical protein
MCGALPQPALRCFWSVHRALILVVSYILKQSICSFSGPAPLRPASKQWPPCGALPRAWPSLCIPSYAVIVSCLPVQTNPRITTSPRRPTGGRAVHPAIGEKLDGYRLDDPNAGKNPAAVGLGKLGGAKRGAARAAALSTRRRKAIATGQGGNLTERSNPHRNEFRTLASASRCVRHARAACRRPPWRRPAVSELRFPRIAPIRNSVCRPLPISMLKSVDIFDSYPSE